MGLAEWTELVDYIPHNLLSLKYYASAQTALAFHSSWHWKAERKETEEAKNPSTWKFIVTNLTQEPPTQAHLWAFPGQLETGVKASLSRHDKSSEGEHISRTFYVLSCMYLLEAKDKVSTFWPFP